ncbi:MAG: D-alanine--D-alanine ligase [Humidesulfovibrio sp.]|uniref:D-alanine--D-alanine ligase n=1 Tax=Humidesulfovibrio sp. TaxID=2910988 RepID=UPI00273678FD|nr:D-alanine--D-alanine ligase [Humidesulfovibrio sp.]MDP2849344.1 D-alanine--D-alanine ligase [Humidesulfovibrio sp.]
MRMILIAGGWSTEREVSLSGARGISEALARLGHQVRFLDPALEFAEIIPAARQADFAFLNLHGSPGEDGLIQAMLEEADCPYQGAGPRASFLALNKAAAKAVYAKAGLRTPAWRLFTGIPGETRETDLPCPLFVKPNTGGSSLGMSRVAAPEDFGPALDKVFALGQAALVEECIPGQELTCAVLADRPLPVILIRPRAGTIFFDYENKYAADGAEEICPAPVDAALTAEVQAMSLAAHKALSIDGYSRSDFMVDASGQPFILETNTLPGMTPTSLLPKAAAAVGLSFDALVAELVRLGLAAHARNSAEDQA